MASYTILTGTVRDHATQSGLVDVEVQVWPATKAAAVPLLSATTDGDGQFVVQLGVASQGLAQSIAFKILQNGRPLELNEAGFRWGGKGPNRTVTIPVLDAIVAPEQPTDPGDIDEPQPEPGGEEDKYVVRGQVLNSNGPAVSGAIVKAVHKKLRSETALGQATTDQKGAYEIQYVVPDGEAQVDLLLRVESSQDEELAISDLICHAEKLEIVDLIVGGEAYRGYSEFEQLVSALTPHLDGVAVESLTAADVAILACKTKLDSVNIAYYVVATRNGVTTGVTPAAFYGFSRMQLPTRLSSVLRQETSVKRRALQNALSGNIIPANLAASIDGILTALQTATVKLVLTEPEDDSSPSMTGLLGAAGLSPDTQETLLLRYVQHEGSNEDFWADVKQDAEFADQVEDIQFTLQLGLLTGNHLPMVTTLMSRKQTGEIQSLKELVGLDTADWATLIEKTGVPTSVTGGTEGDRMSAYARTIAGLLERAFPTPKVASAFVKAGEPGQEDVCQFFKNSPEFDFGTNVDCYLRDHATTALSGVADSDKLKVDLRRFQRCYKMAPTEGRYEAMVALENAGLTTAASILRKGKSGFVRTIARKLEGTEAASEPQNGVSIASKSSAPSPEATKAAELIYAKAEKIAASATVLLAKYSPKFNSIQPTVLTSVPTDGGSTVDIPNWQELFGSLDHCECDDCRSVYSPSAYLVDLLQFLDNSDNYDADVGDNSPREVLLERRPDLAEIELSCANSDTEMPYISLVLEVLENAVVASNSVTTSATGTLSPSAAPIVISPIEDIGEIPMPPIMEISGAFQTSWTVDELDAADEHFNSTAYAPLAEAIYPWLLPFNLPLQEARTYLGHLGVSLGDLMDVFQRPGLPITTIGLRMEEVDILIAAESLEIAPKERVLITTAETSKEDCWGTGSGWPTALADIPTLLDAAELEFVDLLRLLDTRFINADGSLKVSQTAACSTEGSTLDYPTTVELPGGVKEAVVAEPVTASSVPIIITGDLALREALDRIHRFVRLQRKLGWKTLELDEALTALNEEDISDATIVQLADVQHLHDELNVPLLELFSWWSNLSIAVDEQEDEPRSFYEQVFLDKTALDPADPEFDYFQLDGNDLKHAGTEDAEILDDHTTTILAALRITEQELSLLLEHEGMTAADPLNLANLSRLHRNVSLARAIDLSIEDFLSIRVLTGIDPFEVGNTTSTRSLIEQAEAVDESDFSVAELDYLLRHAYEESGGVAPAESTITVFLDEMRDGLQKIADENQFVSDPIGENAQTRLALLLDPEELAQAIALLEDPGTTLVVDATTFIRENFGGFFEDVDAAAAALLDTAVLVDKQARYEYVLESLVEYLRKSLSEQLVFQKTADSFDLEVDVATALVSGHISLAEDADLIAALSGIIEFIQDPDGELARDRLGVLLAEDEVGTAMAILGGTSTLAEAEQLDFVTTYFAAFLPDIDAGKASLVGGAALAAGQARFEYVLQPLAAWLKASLVDWYRLTYKVALVLSRFEVVASELSWAFEKGPALGWLDLSDLPLVEATDEVAAARFAGWLRLVDLFSFRDQHTAGDTTVFTVLAQVHEGATQEEVLLTLATLTGWDAEELADLTGVSGLGLTYSSDFQDERFLVRLEEAIDVLDRLGMSCETVGSWSVSDDLTAMQSTATAIKNAVKAKYDSEKWPEVAEPLKDELREKQRDALAAYLIATTPDFEDTTDLYDHYLIDVEMNACMQTSRIKQALCSIQLFVQRCLMNLEPEVGLTEAAAEQWSWMKAYRLWEANRKVFLYAENWIEPELRDNKSPFFKDLEDELLQNEVTDATAETAFLNYLQRVDEVANLRVCALYHQKEEADGKTSIDIVHVVAQTFGTPTVYYYRQFVADSYWTAWERLDLDIEGNHLLLTVWNRRLYLIWAIISQKDDSVLEEGATEPGKTWEIQLAWSEYMNGAWSAKKMTTEVLGPIAQMDAFEIRNNTNISLFYFRAEVDDGAIDSPFTAFAPVNVINPILATGTDELVVSCHYYNYLDTSRASFYYGKFRFLGCNGQVLVECEWENEKVAYSSEVVPILPPLTTMHEMEFRELEFVANDSWDTAANDSALELYSAQTDTNGTYDGSSALDSLPTLNETPGQFCLVIPIQYNEFVSQDHFIYQDDNRSFFVTPTETLQADYFSGLEFADDIGIDTDYMAHAQLVTPSAPSVSILRTRMLGPVGAMGGTEAAAFSMAASNTSDTLLGDTSMYDTVKRILDDDAGASLPQAKVTAGREFRFKAFYHPYVTDFIKVLNRDGIDGLLQREMQSKTSTFFKSTYSPQSVVDTEYPDAIVDFSESGAYSPYNWELFFHAPLLIADRLSQNQQFDDAQKWFHYIFNPTARTDSNGETGTERYWVFYPFYQENSRETIYDLMLDLNYGDPEVADQIEQWRADPFDPHLIARLRPVAYMKTVVMKYIDNLISWGDSLFSQDTIESINEATQLYVLASKILGDRPQLLPETDVEEEMSYKDVEGALDLFSNVENLIGEPVETNVSGEGTSALLSLYFCVPENVDLLKRWDTVEDRLFKIRNCMNIEGVERSLAVYEPSIDPGMLVKAVAAGVDIGSVLSDLYAPLPYYRFQLMLQKAVEFGSDVRSLGSALLSALEKGDGEVLALLRASHENELLDASKAVKEKQVEEAESTVESLTLAKALAQLRVDYYGALSFLNTGESLSLALHAQSMVSEALAQKYEKLASNWYKVPDISASFSFPDPGGSVSSSFGGSFFGKKAQAQAGFYRYLAGVESGRAGVTATLGGYERRKEEWEFQESLASKEVEQLEKQIAAAGIRVEIATQELANHEKQIEQSKAIYDLMANKYTNQDLYSWMVTQLSSLYFQSYKLAYDLAKRAERCFQNELGVDTSFIQFGYWDSLKKGLLAGDKLHYDLRRMDAAYVENNKRTFELTKHISLSQVDPVALLILKESGECYVNLPEAIFDLDYAGHYQRRIKSVSLTIPCVAGPYTTVSCTLTLLSSSIRISTTASADGEDYARDESSGADSRFKDLYGATQSIATSHGSRDSGLFELSLNDERYLPFEWGGVISQWRLELPKSFRPFDYSSISDVILHMQYTAKDGGSTLRTAALASLQSQALSEMPLGKDGTERIGLYRAFSLRHEFPNEWHQLLHGTGSEDPQVVLDLGTTRFPARYQETTISITRLDVYVKVESDDDAALSKVSVDPAGAGFNDLVLTDSVVVTGFLSTENNASGPQGEPGKWTLKALRSEIDMIAGSVKEIVLVCEFELS